MKFTGITATLFATLLIGACGSGSVNDTIRIADGETREGGARSVNGSIIVGNGAVLEGNINSVNGNVDLDDGATAGDIKTVNGSIRLGSQSRSGAVDSVNGGIRARRSVHIGSVNLVNGSLDTDAETVIEGDVFLINGSAELRGTRVAGDIVAYGGQVTLIDGSEAAQNIVIRKPRGTFSMSDKPRVIVGPDSHVVGKVIAERPIRLFVHDSASVGGVEGAEVEPYTDNPESGD